MITNFKLFESSKIPFINTVDYTFYVGDYVYVDTADSGKKALGLMSKKKYHVVITDIKMPRMDGIQLLRKIRQEYPMTHCIMITGYVTMQNVLDCMRHGADTCIFKPFEDLKELDVAITSAISHLNHWEIKLKKGIF